VREQPVYVPSATGPLGAILATPDGGPSGTGIVFLSGSHIPRFNKNGMWTRAARELTDRGFVTLRVDEDGAGESSGEPERWPVSRINPSIPAAGTRFLVDEVGVSRVLIAATCYGARLGIAAAAEEPEVDGILFIAAPVMGLGRRKWASRQARRVLRKVGIHPSRPPRISPKFQEPFLRYLERGGRVHFLYGDKDPFLEEVHQMLEMLRIDVEPHRDHISIEVIPGHELHAFKSADAQAKTIAAAVRWASGSAATPSR
jgi:pimeloyl-ACP methyl ester carboxylesterase